MAKHAREILLGIGKKIRKNREIKGWTQSDLADRMGFSDYRLISQFENGRRDLRVSTLLRLSVALGTTPQDLLPEPSPRLSGSDEDLLLLVREVSRCGSRDRERAKRVLHALMER